MCSRCNFLYPKSWQAVGHHTLTIPNTVYLLCLKFCCLYGWASRTSNKYTKVKFGSCLLILNKFHLCYFIHRVLQTPLLYIYRYLSVVCLSVCLLVSWQICPAVFSVNLVSQVAWLAGERHKLCVSPIIITIIWFKLGLDRIHQSIIYKPLNPL